MRMHHCVETLFCWSLALYVYRLKRIRRIHFSLLKLIKHEHFNNFIVLVKNNLPCIWTKKKSTLSMFQFSHLVS